jgi:hypothetical protein
MDSERCRYYDPFQEPALFRIFADLDGSQETILSFCNQFGPASLLVEDSRPPTHSGANSLADWRDDIKEMQTTISLLDAIQSGDNDAIARQRESLIKQWWMIECWEAPERYRSLPAEELLSRAIHHNFRTDPRVRLTPGPEGVMKLAISVDSLKDAMWLQLALSIVNRKEYRRCEHCGRPFLLSPEENRADRRYHNDSCRVKAYRLRKAKAVKMRTAGAPLRTIVKELDSDIETVRKWLGEGK